MTTARSETIIDGEEAVYHCHSRCVRRAYLCGEDRFTGKNFNHRKQWVKSRLEFLASVFAIDVLGFSLMSTHAHEMLRTRPDILKNWSNREVASRWTRLYPKHTKEQKLTEESQELQIQKLLNNKKRIKVLRQRLGSLSWFMKSLNEYIAHKANREDGVTGHFWEGRFKCVRLEDEAAILACSIYIDLNPIRAEIAQTPEESVFTSAYERIKSLKEGNASLIEPVLWLNSIGDTAKQRGFLSLNLIEYLSVLDSTGRELQEGKRGRISPHLDPILKRIGIEPEHWMSTSRNFGEIFPRVAGCQRSMNTAAKRAQKKWFQGIRTARSVFL